MPFLFALLPAQALTPPTWEGAPDLRGPIEEALRHALEATSSQGPWPGGPWRVWLHQDSASFERATGAPPQRSGQWVGDTLHLRPWDQLRRRDLGGLLRHELTHRRLSGSGLPRWEEEARCLWAEGHVKAPRNWPKPPAPTFRARLDRALAGGTTREQAWAYRCLRAWLRGDRPPDPPRRSAVPEVPWVKEALVLDEAITVVWPAERIRGPLVVNGQRLSHGLGRTWRFRGPVRFGLGFPLSVLEGMVVIQAEGQGWRVAWTASRIQWVAAATDGELGAEAPFEARRALAALLGCWLDGHPRQHPGGVLCPLTHCAVVRGMGCSTTLRAADTVPKLDLDPRWAFFTGSAGGQRLSPREVWGQGPGEAGPGLRVPEDAWASWDRTLSPIQVQALKRDVKPGLDPGQRGLKLGESGPYAIERLRLAAGRRFGWTTWPSNACQGETLPDGSLRLKGEGWGHNVGLCMATARFRAASGATAEEILREAFPASWRRP